MYQPLESPPVLLPPKAKLVEVMNERDEPGESMKLLRSMVGGGEEGCGDALARLLGSDPIKGIAGDEEDLAMRVRAYDGNFFAEKRLKTYLELVWDGLHDATLILLMAMAAIVLVTETYFGEHPETGWIEPVVLFISVAIIVNVAASIDYVKERMFHDLSQQLNKSNLKTIVRNGRQLEVEDSEIVVGDVLCFNAHNRASIPADGILVAGDGCKFDESALTGEPEPMHKDLLKNPLVVSGTNAVAGSGRMLVIAVGANSVSGKIRATVYGEDEDEEGSPLFQKLDVLVVQIGKFGGVAAGVCVIAMCVIGFLFTNADADVETKLHLLLEYVITGITILAVAVPEGLPLAVTLALAYSSKQMMSENNLVKHLDACETMGSATTICTDKTGTLTANRMTVRAIYLSETTTPPSDAEPLGQRLLRAAPAETTAELARLIAIDTMDESYILPPKDRMSAVEYKGNPTECALLALASEMGFNIGELRQGTEGRSDTSKGRGRPILFSSARKMMSWAVPTAGGWRLYCKGASEVILGRCTSLVRKDGTAAVLHDDAPVGGSSASRASITSEVIRPFASQAMRTIGLAYRDLPADADFAATHAVLKNADGSAALAVETELTLLGVVGIEDPLRPEVAPAIDKCFKAGIDVRMVTGDNLDTAIAIASRCGILRDEHFLYDGKAPGQRRLKRNRAMEGRDFRKRVYHEDAETGEFVFDQDEFDRLWPYLRVLARSSPEDKLTLADGLNKSYIFQDAQTCAKLHDEGITIFPDRQVVAMTGDGTNDAPALKRADVGFAMNITGTQIAKDACDIVLIDDNFASIVVAVKWGRNVYDSISKFLQFQLTVNIVAITLAICGAFVFQESPIAAVQMLWVNLIMDSLASLALATEPPTDALLDRPPVNRSQSLVTRQMWFNMVGHALYQLAVCFWILFEGPKTFVDSSGQPLVEGHQFERENHGAPSQHLTILFNAFVMMTLFNEINARKLKGENNILGGFLSNPVFLAVVGTTFVLQLALVQCSGRAFRCYEGGLSPQEWLFCLAVGAGSLPMQLFINLLASMNRTPGSGREGGCLKFKTRFGNGNVIQRSQTLSTRAQ